jgi:hypothetical protein
VAGEIPAEKPQEFVTLSYDWQGAADVVPMRHANQVMAQVHGQELLLLFFVTSPPILIGTPDQVRTQVESITTLKTECVARISLNPKMLKSTIDLMQTKLAEYEATEVKGDGATI